MEDFVLRFEFSIGRVEITGRTVFGRANLSLATFLGSFKIAVLWYAYRWHSAGTYKPSNCAASSLNRKSLKSLMV